MAAVRPRVSVVLDEDVLDTIRRVAIVENRSVSAVIGELLSEMEPGLRKVAELGEALEAAQGDQLEAIRAAVQAGDEAVAAPLAAAMAALSRAWDEARSAVGVEAGRPPLGNTGVRLL